MQPFSPFPSFNCEGQRQRGRNRCLRGCITMIYRDRFSFMKMLSCLPAELMVVLALTSRQSLAQSVYEPYTFTTFAGGGGFGSPDTSGSAVRISNPAGVAVDGAGNVYVADT